MVDMQQYFDVMRDVYDVCAALGLKSYIWGGFAVDILHGSLTRGHGDLIISPSIL